MSQSPAIGSGSHEPWASIQDSTDFNNKLSKISWRGFSLLKENQTGDVVEIGRFAAVWQRLKGLVAERLGAVDYTKTKKVQKHVKSLLALAIAKQWICDTVADKAKIKSVAGGAGIDPFVQLNLLLRINLKATDILDTAASTPLPKAQEPTFSSPAPSEQQKASEEAISSPTLSRPTISPAKLPPTQEEDSTLTSTITSPVNPPSRRGRSRNPKPLPNLYVTPSVRVNEPTRDEDVDVSSQSGAFALPLEPSALEAQWQEVNDLLPAAQSGAADAMETLGILYENLLVEGKQKERADEEAAKWLGLAAKKGRSLAMTELGAMYVEGRVRGVDQEEANLQALKLFFGAEQVSDSAKTWLALMYMHGLVKGGNPPKNEEDRLKKIQNDDKQAVSYLTTAARNGYKGAMKLLAEMYRQGRVEGFSKESAEGKAKYWKNRAEQTSAPPPA